MQQPGLMRRITAPKHEQRPIWLLVAVVLWLAGCVD